MRLLRLHLNGFGTFHRGVDVRFAPDRLNVVVGRNEAGKSTLLAGIAGTFFGFRDLNLRRRYESWDTHTGYEGTVELETDDGRRLRITRDFLAQRACITEIGDDGESVIFEGSADPRGATAEDRGYFDELRRILGVDDEGVFKSTVFMGQQSLETSISDQVRRLIGGAGDADYRGALHELHRRYAHLTDENPWRRRGSGPKQELETARDRLADQRSRLREGQAARVRAAELELAIEDGTAASARARALQADTETRLAAAREALELLRRREDAERRYQEALGRRDQFHRYAQRIADLDLRLQGDLGRYARAPEDFAETLRSLASATKDEARDREELEEVRRELATLRPVPNERAGLISGALAGGAAGLLSPLLGLGLIPAILLAAVLAPLGWALGRIAASGHGAAKARLGRRIAELGGRINQHVRRAQDARDQAGPILAGLDPETAQREFREARELREERRRVVAAQKALGDRAAVEAAFEEGARIRGALLEALDGAAARHSFLGAIRTPAEAEHQISALRSEADARARTLAACEAGLQSARVELAGLSGRTACDLVRLEESVREEEARVDRMEFEKEALREAIDTLDACLRDFQESDSLRLADDVTAIFARITGERYTRVTFSPSMDPVLSRGDSVPIQPGDLSQGARDQLYFALRVALARHLSRQAKLPLFLDDPFVNFDEERLRVTRDVLGRLQDHQVVLVTCDRDYESWTDAVIDLDRAAAARS
jgi:DNA repair exonuclease SbcCD ATPase subunit